MYAQFTTEKEAQDFTDAIHTRLCETRTGYESQTTIWSPVIKHHTEDLWAVPLPPEAIPGEYTTIDNIDGWIAASESEI